MDSLGLLALSAAVLVLLQLVAAVEARTRALPVVPRSGVASARRRPHRDHAEAADPARDSDRRRRRGRASLALDPAGNPRIGHDAEHWWYGFTDDQFKRDCNYKDATVTRIALFDRPLSAR